MADISLHLPSIFPTEGPITTSEDIRYNTFITDDSDVNAGIVEETEYTLNKSPVISITEVEGISDGKSVSFDEGVDYELSDDLSSIRWLENVDSTRPDAGTSFTVSYRSQSVLNRYITAGEQELELVENSMSLTRQKKVIDSATGEELDRIGDLFGVLGDRGDRDDIEYRTFLKSIVKSFISRGTVNDIITALSAATDVPPEDITINEDFTKNEYEVEILAQTAVRGSIIEDVTEIADPSGVDLSTTRFVIPTDEIQSEDIFNSTFGNKILDSIQNNDLLIINGNLVIASDDLLSNDAIASPRRDAIDNTELDELVLLDDNKFINSDELLSEDITESLRRDAIDNTELDELVLLDDNKFINSDELLSEDITESLRRDAIDNTELDESLIFNDKNVNSHRWEENREGAFNTEWGFFSWTELRDLVQNTIDVSSFDDNIPESPQRNTIDKIDSNDILLPDSNKFINSDELLCQDVTESTRRDTIDNTELDESLTFNDKNVNSHRWEENREGAFNTEWGFFSWTELRDLIQQTIDVGSSDDKFSVGNKKIIDTDNSSVTDQFTEGDKSIIEVNQNISDEFTKGDKSIIKVNQNISDEFTKGDKKIIDVDDSTVADVIDPDTSNKITDVDNSVDLINNEVRDKNQQRWSEHRWNLFSWSEIISLGTFTSNDLSSTDDKFSVGDKNEVREIDNLTDSISIEVRTNSQQRWSSHQWDFFVWT